MESTSDSESDLEELARLKEAVGGVPQENRGKQGIEVKHLINILL